MPLLPNNYETNDLALAAWLLIKGATLTGNYKESRKKCVFSFAISKKEADALVMEYMDSECAQFDEAVRRLKKLLHS